jgi:triosephosphate isomerase
MVKNFGINWAILGHSERRHVFGESDEVVAKKIKLALENGI